MMRLLGFYLQVRAAARAIANQVWRLNSRSWEAIHGFRGPTTLALARDAIGDLISLATAINTHVGLDLGYLIVILGEFLAAGMMAFVMLQFVAPVF
jgi:hypothetical protein